ncbi:hypothetical protein LguiB_008316 [Lonicera macranthoides]
MRCIRSSKNHKPAPQSKKIPNTCHEVRYLLFGRHEKEATIITYSTPNFHILHS